MAGEMPALVEELREALEHQSANGRACFYRPPAQKILNRFLALTPSVHAGSPALTVDGVGDGECFDATVSPCVVEYIFTVGGEEKVGQLIGVDGGQAPGLHPFISNPQSDGHVVHTNFPTCLDFEAPFDSCVCDNGDCDGKSTDIFCSGTDDCVSIARRNNIQTKCGAEGLDFVAEFCLLDTFTSRGKITGGTGAYEGATGQVHTDGVGEFLLPCVAGGGPDGCVSFVFPERLAGVIKIK